MVCWSRDFFSEQLSTATSTESRYRVLCTRFATFRRIRCRAHLRFRCPGLPRRTQDGHPPANIEHESVVGIGAIVGGGILALAGLQSNYISGNARARLQTEATALGAHVIEQLRSMQFDAPDLDPATNPHQPPAGSTGPYDVQWNVTDNAPVNNTKTVNVSVAPVNRNGRPVRLSTIIAER